MRAKVVVVLLCSVIVAMLAAASPGEETPKIDREKYLEIAKQLAATVERTARHQGTGLYASAVDIETGELKNNVKNNYANWYMNGLWMLYWNTGDDKYLEWIDRQSDALWSVSADPDTGMPYIEFDLEKRAPVGDLQSHRIQYQVCAHKYWDEYMRSLRSAMKYQMVTDAAGNRMALHDISIKDPERPGGRHAPDFFGCLDLRIPYALGTIEGRPELYDTMVDDFYAHTIRTWPSATRLWSGTMVVPHGAGMFSPLYKGDGSRPHAWWKPGMFFPTSVWSGTIADDTYTGLILRDLAGKEELMNIVEDQTRLALKYCFDEDEHYFYQGVSTITGTPVDPKPRWHTNWEFALTMYILHAETGDPEWLEAAEKNYRFVVDNHAHPGHYAMGQGSDWNVPQVVLLSLFRYHQTGETRYLEDAIMVADYLIENRLTRRGDDVFVGVDGEMLLREAGDMIAMLVCLSDEGLPVVSSRYFLFPVGIRSVSFPVFENAFVTRYHTRDDGVLEAKIEGGDGMTEDIYVMHLSGDIEEVKVNGKRVDFSETRIAGHRYIMVPDIRMGKVHLEVFSP